jgi:hypothetical protein
MGSFADRTRKKNFNRNGDNGEKGYLSALYFLFTFMKKRQIR